MCPTVLVVEDDAATRTLLSVVLTRAGYQVDTVANGTDALTLLSHVGYSAVALDLYIHDTSGHDILASLAATTPDALQHVVIVSAAPVSQIDQLRARYAGVRTVRKPFELQDLVDEIGRAAAQETVIRDFNAEFCRRSVLLGAKSGIILTSLPNGSAFELVTTYGFPPGVLEEFLPIPIDGPYPICKSYRLARDIWISSVTLATNEYPLLSGVWKAAGAKALVTLPVASNGRTIGAVGWAFREPRPFEAEDRVQFGKVASFVSDSLGNSIATSAAS
jgi:CheY-like chemotaxis protein